MEKETELWDDSALLKAFDNGISKYKKMHKKAYGDNPTRKEEEEEEEQAMNITNENEPTITNSVTEACLSSYDTGPTNGLPPIQNNQLGAESSASEPHKHSSSASAVQETFEGYTEVQGAEYSQLLSQYYELEEQKQKVLNQIHQSSVWNYQTFTEGSGSRLPWNVCCAAPQAQLPTHCTSYPGHCSYCPTCCVAPCPSIPTCAMGGQCFSENGTHAIATACTIDPGRPPSCADNSIVKAGMEAAERAISSMNLNTSMMPNIHEEKATAEIEGSGRSDGVISQNNGLETDLTVVLNAWYSAGFYTGKYLSEQSLAKSRH